MIHKLFIISTWFSQVIPSLWVTIGRIIYFEFKFNAIFVIIMPYRQQQVGERVPRVHLISIVLSMQISNMYAYKIAHFEIVINQILNDH